jgi:glycosyltransferase involved in cell wall biosynthesis
MKILFDHQAFTIQDYGGISRYFYELARQIQCLPNMEVANSLLFSNNDYLLGNDVFKRRSFFSFVRTQKKTEAMNLINQAKSKLDFSRGRFDIFHPTYYDPYYVNMPSTKPVVITFHDLIHEKFMNYDQRTLAHKKKALTRADKIIAISQSSKNDLIEYYKIPESKVEVIYLASSFNDDGGDHHRERPESYLLYVGSRNHYKNFQFFLKSLAPLIQKIPNLFVYCAGGGKFTSEERSLFKRLRVEPQVRSCSGSDENLQKLYKSAVAYFCPSQYEGFGIPVVEAMNCGCPVATSAMSSLPEIAGTAALYFNPNDSESILSAAERLVNEPDLRSDLTAKGRLRSKDFSWEKTARETVRFYESL